MGCTTCQFIRARLYASRNNAHLELRYREEYARHLAKAHGLLVTGVRGG